MIQPDKTCIRREPIYLCNLVVLERQMHGLYVNLTSTVRWVYQYQYASGGFTYCICKDKKGDKI